MGKTLLRLGALMVIDASALGFAYALYANGTIAFAVVLIAVTALINVIFLSERLAPWRWISPGLALMVLLVLYPTAYTVYIGFTNYGDQHLLSRGQAVAQLEDEYFIPEGALTYDWTAYQASGGNLLLYLESEETQPFIVTADGTQPAAERLGSEPGSPPEQIDDFARLDQTETVGLLARLENFAAPSGDAGPQGSEVRILSLDEAAPQRQKYDYEALSGELTDKETGTVYTAEDGFFISEEGERISPGFAAVVGVENFTRIFTDPDIRGPFVGVFIWTLVFAALSVVTTFALGVGLALLLNDQQLPFRGLFRSLTIIPYTIPFFITALVWVGLLNPIYGPINQIIEFFTGLSPQWFSDGTLAKVAILMINLWLGFPYMMIVCLGALQSIPEEVHEAAAIDGANAFHRFFYMTLPLLLVSVGPLLLGVFAFNFNNFGIIELVTQGGPPNPEAGTPAGQTDILISYTYRLAFASGQGTDYGLAAAVSVFIFILVALITIFNFRLTRRLEEVS